VSILSGLDVATGGTSALYRWAAYALAIVLYTMALVIGSCSWGEKLRQNEIDAAQLQATQAQDKANAAERKRQAADNDATVAKKALADAKASKTFADIRQEIPHATVIYKYRDRQVPVAVAVDCPFSNDFVRVWNDALTAGLPDAAGGAAAATAGRDHAQAQQPSGVTQQDVLTNHVDNREVETRVRNQCESLIDWHHRNDARAVAP
jgi:hypothetical protein